MPSAVDEARLARAAAGGDGRAFAVLYDAYERRIFTYCQRIVGSPDDAADATQDAFVKVLQRLPSLQDRDLNFGAYLFTAARNASYDVIGRRKKADAVDEIPEHGSRPVLGDEGGRLDEDPERTALTGALQEQVRVAHERLPERQREVLVLREVEELSYDEIGEIMGMNRNAVAQLISRARIKLRAELRGDALASIVAASADCERALPLIAMRQDRQLQDGADAAWLEQHLAGCETCKAGVEAMEEAGLSYRAWAPVLPFAWMFRETMAEAAELTGSDWSEIIAAGRPSQGPRPGDERDGGGLPVAGGTSHRRRRGAAAVLGALLLVLLGTALVTGDDDPPQAGATTPTATQAAAQATATPATPATTATPRKAGRRESRRAAAPATAPVVRTVTTTTPSGDVVTRRVVVPRPVRRPKTTSTTKQTGGKALPPARRPATGTTPAAAPQPAPPPQAPEPTPTPTPTPPPEPPPATTTTPPPTQTTPPPPQCSPNDPRCCRDNPGATGCPSAGSPPRQATALRR